LLKRHRLCNKIQILYGVTKTVKRKRCWNFMRYTKRKFIILTFFKVIFIQLTITLHTFWKRTVLKICNVHILCSQRTSSKIDEMTFKISSHFSTRSIGKGHKRLTISSLKIFLISTKIQNLSSYQWKKNSSKVSDYSVLYIHKTECKALCFLRRQSVVKILAY
jgi:hypothetical protein